MLSATSRIVQIYFETIFVFFLRHEQLVPATLPALFSTWCRLQWASVSAGAMWRARPATHVNLCTGTSPPTLLMDAPVRDTSNTYTTPYPMFH